MKLHYSQTNTVQFPTFKKFDYHIKSHYSQTQIRGEGRETPLLCAVIPQVFSSFRFDRTQNKCTGKRVRTDTPPQGRFVQTVSYGKITLWIF